MSLTTALNTARSSLAANATQTSVISRNVAGANNPDFSRKTAVIGTSSSGGVQVFSIERAANTALFFNMLDATSLTARHQAVNAGLDQLELTVGDPELEQSPAAKLGQLQAAIQQFSSASDDPILAQSVLNAAHDMASALRDATTTVQQAREQADADMSTSVERINTLLSRFEIANTAVVNGTRTRTDVTDSMDTRDAILADLSEEIGIRVLSRGDNDLVIYTDSGATLFENRPRSVTFEPIYGYGAVVTGNAVIVDGVPVTGPTAAMPIKSGRLQGLASFRDEVAVVYQTQLDEIARGLVEVFSEADQTVPPALPRLPGLFTYPGAPAMPATGTAVPGLAGVISVNANADPEQGGSLDRIRDGGISDPGNPAYVYNTSGGTGFTGRLQGILDDFAGPRLFDPSTQADPTNNLIGFASSSISWLEAGRNEAVAQISYQTVLLQRSSEALSNATGVSIEEEMTIMLELERSYQASAKLISVVDSMLATLMNAVR